MRVAAYHQVPGWHGPEENLLQGLLDELFGRGRSASRSLTAVPNKMEVKNMINIATGEFSLMEDRGVMKVRVNMMKNGRLIGFIKPV